MSERALWRSTLAGCALLFLVAAAGAARHIGEMQGAFMFVIAVAALGAVTHLWEHR